MAKIQNKKDALKAAMLQIHKQYGQGAIMKMGDFKMPEVRIIPTGSLALDIA